MRTAFLILAAALTAAGARAETGLSVSTSSTAAPPSVSAPEKHEPEANISVEKIVFAVEISSKVAVGAADSFDESVQEVYCWNQLAVGHIPAKVTHEWYRNDRKVGELTILARFHRMRIWSKRKIRAGQWRVEIKDADSGEPIAVGAFLVRKAPL